MATIRNYTPHAVTVFPEYTDRDWNPPAARHTYPSEGVARCAAETRLVGQIGGIPITQTVMGQIEGLPDFEDGVILIVSRIVADASDRCDLVYPNELIRDAVGRVLGCKSLASNHAVASDSLEAHGQLEAEEMAIEMGEEMPSPQHLICQRVSLVDPTDPTGGLYGEDA